MRISKKIAAFTLCTAILCSGGAVPSCAAEPQTARQIMTVESKQVVQPEGCNLFGYNDDYSWINEWRGFGNSESAQMLPGYYETLQNQQFEIPLIRGFFHDIDWKITVGPQRGYRDGNHLTFGMVEWIQSVQSITPDAQFAIVVNIDDSAENIQDLVRFLTLQPDNPNAVGSDGTNWAQKRVEYGLAEPVDVVCFELGNEYDMKYYSDGIENLAANAAEYIEKCRPVNEGIKTVNPQAKTSVLSFTTPHDTGKAGWAQIWDNAVIGEMGTEVEYIVIHYYYHNYESGTIPAEEFDKIIEPVAAVIREQIPEETQRPQLFISEHAVYVDPNYGSDTASETKYAATRLSGALTTAEFLNYLSVRGDVGLAAYHSLWGNPSAMDNYGGHCWGDLRYFQEDGNLYISAVGEIFRVLRKAFCGQTVRSSLQLAGEFPDVTIPGQSEPQANLLSASAHRMPEGGLNLVLVNKNTGISHEVTFELDGMYHVQKEVVLSGTSREDKNTPHTPDAVFARERRGSDSKKFSGTYTVPPLSAVALYLLPENTETSNSNAEMWINGIFLENGTEVAEQNGKLQIDGVFYDNCGLSAAESVALTITDAETGQLLFIDQKQVSRQRVHFEAAVPETVFQGTYKLSIGNRSLGDQSVQTWEFTYTPHERAERIKAESFIQQGEQVAVTLTAQDEAYIGQEFQIQVRGKADSSLVHIGIDTQTAAVQQYHFRMPQEALAGEYVFYILYSESCGMIQQKPDTFTYGKPDEIILAAPPQQENGERLKLDDIHCSQKFTVNLRNQTDITKQAIVIAAFFDKQGRLAGSSMGETIEVGAQGSQSCTLTLPEIKEELSTAKIFVWDSSDGLHPYTDVYLIKE